ncbi:secoisolariciresinol dehydrogenase-like [Coffea arabica]|uniref:Secoisolariciresinol dehydrogenase-like n=1 Tax=Coffea arabica TaxID=13443 RepID=A0ABM4VCE3_COFAR
MRAEGEWTDGELMMTMGSSRLGMWKLGLEAEKEKRGGGEDEDENEDEEEIRILSALRSAGTRDAVEKSEIGDSSSTALTSTRRLEGKVAIITDGASGIGESTTRLFVHHGAKVIIADIQDELGRALCEDLGCKEAVSYVHCDVSNESDVQNAVETAIAKHGKLDIMFSNAGIIDNCKNISDVGYDDYMRVFNVNVFGAFMCAKHAAKVMIPAKKGSIIFTSSAVTAGDVTHVYATTKKALLGLSESLCMELGQHGIRVNCVSPFALPTPLLTREFGNVEKEKAEGWFYQAANLKHAVFEVEDVA